MARNPCHEIAPGVIEMELTHGKTTQFDADMLETLGKYNWKALKSTYVWYVMAKKRGKMCTVWFFHCLAKPQWTTSMATDLTTFGPTYEMAATVK